ncbi:MAG: YwaF family protein [Clostridia bacterium]|nr:YwaF family protein [Clostridia bacterium]
MYAQLHALLCDKKGGTIFTCFGGWHFCYILIAVLVAVIVWASVRKRGREAQQKAAQTLINIAFGMYVADFFLMPFAYEYIDIEKLPFHICTAMCVMCFLSRHVKALQPLRAHFALLGFLSNLVYLIYPAGVMWHAVHPLCYRVWQTLLFHGMMTTYGFVALMADRKDLSLRDWPRHLAVVCGMTLWALLGNALYTGAAGSYDHDFNWFFVTADPFGLLPPSAARLAMPFINTALFFAVEMGILALFVRRRNAR